MPKYFDLGYKKACLRYYFKLKADDVCIVNLYKIFKLAKSTLYMWLDEYNNGLINIDDEKDAHQEKKKYISGRKSKLTEEILEYVKNSLIQFKNIISIKTLRINILEMFKVQVTKATIFRAIKLIKFSRKKATFTYYPHSEEKFNKQKNILKLALKDKNNRHFISLDETAVDLTLQPLYGYSPKGKRCYVKKKVKNTRLRCSLCVAISNKKVVGYKLIRNTFNAVDFTNFFNETILTNTKKEKILMDNARIHRSKYFTIDTKQSNNKKRIIYNVPYSPQFNAIELFFSDLKRTIAEKQFKNVTEFETFLGPFMNNYKSELLEGYFKKSLDMLYD